ncbi:hypothetical protein ILUMI_04022 [Ignelater luminosus]|uniref:Uncharacterized protein n=1 Tax=Ignelater luminosus TaxID=2038154 RepID=A0A8K0DDD4_IGNLU|nr:hypothetical protein ILUMI_04022 [Ignelater luminosus]
MFNIHAPTEEKENEIKDMCDEEIDKAVNKIPNRDTIIIILEANIKIGREKIYREAIAKHKESNNNGHKNLIDKAGSLETTRETIEQIIRETTKKLISKKKSIEKQNWLDEKYERELEKRKQEV